MVHLTQQEGNRGGKVSICDECATDLGFDDPEAMSAAQIVSIGTLITEHGEWKQSGSGPLDG